MEVCTRFKEFLGREAVIKNGLGVKETAEEISKLDYLIAMRFHAVLAGLMSGVKVLPVSYDKKVSFLSLEAGVDYIELNHPDGLEEKIKILKDTEPRDLSGWLKTKRLDVNIFDI